MIILFTSRGFRVGALSVYSGDCVYVRNADSPDPDSPEGCDIARIIRCYDSGIHRLYVNLFIHEDVAQNRTTNPHGLVEQEKIVKFSWWWASVAVVCFMSEENIRQLDCKFSFLFDFFKQAPNILSFYQRIPFL